MPVADREEHRYSYSSSLWVEQPAKQAHPSRQMVELPSHQNVYENDLHSLVNEMRLQVQYDAVLSVSCVGKVHVQMRKVSGRGRKRGQERQSSQGPQSDLSLARSALWRTPQPFVPCVPPHSHAPPLPSFLASLQRRIGMFAVQFCSIFLVSRVASQHAVKTILGREETRAGALARKRVHRECTGSAHTQSGCRRVVN